jgi:hypothetical protein
MYYQRTHTYNTLPAAAKPTKGFGPAHGKQVSTPLAIGLNWREIRYAPASDLISEPARMLLFQYFYQENVFALNF